MIFLDIKFIQSVLKILTIEANADLLTIEWYTILIINFYRAKVITLEAYGLLSRIETAVDNHERASLIKQFEEEESSNIILDTLEKMRRLRFSDGVQAMLLILSDLIEVILFTMYLKKNK